MRHPILIPLCLAGMAMLAARNLIAWASGEPLLTPVPAS